MSHTKKLCQYEDAMETVCDECQSRHNMNHAYCEEQCMVRTVWYNILDEVKESEEKNMLTREMIMMF